MGRVLQFRGKQIPESPVSVTTNPATLCWCIQTYHDAPALRRCLARLRKIYPNSRIMVISDGDTNPRLPRLCGKYRAQFVMGERLFRVEHGGEVVHRMLEYFLRDEKSEVLIKIDPDTVVRRPLKKILSAGANAIAGTIIMGDDNTVRAIQGGFIAISRFVAQSWVDNRVLQAKELKPPQTAWAVSAAGKARAATGLTSHDWSISWACRMTGVILMEHPEVRSFWKFEAYKYGAMRDAAVSHPEYGFRQVLAGQRFLWGLRYQHLLRRLTGKP